MRTRLHTDSQNQQTKESHRNTHMCIESALGVRGGSGRGCSDGKFNSAYVLLISHITH